MLDTLSDVKNTVLQKFFPEGKNFTLSAAEEEKAQEMYQMAYQLYNKQRYVDAGNYFRLLVTLAPFISRHWKGLGACLQMQREYEQALDCYLCTEVLQGKIVDSYLYLNVADCYFALKNVPQGLKALEAAHASAAEKKDTRVLEHVALMQKLWSQPINK